MPKISLSLAFAIAFLFVLTKGSDDEQEYDFGSAETADNQLATETVVEFLAKLGTLSAATADVGAFMDRISLSAFAFLKLGYPVGALIAGALHISTKTETEEYKALVKLRDSMEKNFEEMKRMISVAKNVINMKIGLKDYINNVHVPLADFRIQMDVFWDPAVEKDAEDVQEFKKSCSLMRLKDSVLEVFNYIFTHTVENCKNGLSQKQIALLGNFVPLLRSFRMKMDNEIERGLFDKKMADLSIWFTELDNKLAKKVLEKMQELSNNTSSFDSANYALNVLQSFRDDYRSEARPNQCILQDIITGKNYNRKAIEEFQNMMRMDVLQLMIFGSVCANVSFSGSPSKMEKFQKKIVEKVVAIMENVQHYVEIELEKSFPEIEMGIAKTKIKEMQLATPVGDNATIFKVTVEVMNELNKFGNRKYFRQGFISTNLANETDFTLRCYSENCFVILDYNSLHIMVTRFDIDNDEFRAVDSYEWLFRLDPVTQTNAARFLAKFIDDHYNINKVSKLLDWFERRHFPLTNEAFFHNIAILRNSGSTGKCGVMATPFYYAFGNYTDTCMVHYYYAGSMWRDCESYIVYFFL